MTLGVDAGGGATGRPSADGSVGAGGAAGGSGGRALAPQSWRARRRRGWRHEWRQPYCVIRIPVLPGKPARRLVEHVGRRVEIRGRLQSAARTVEDAGAVVFVGVGKEVGGSRVGAAANGEDAARTLCGCGTAPAVAGAVEVEPPRAPGSKRPAGLEDASFTQAVSRAAREKVTPRSSFTPRRPFFVLLSCARSHSRDVERHPAHPRRLVGDALDGRAPAALPGQGALARAAEHDGDAVG